MSTATAEPAVRVALPVALEPPRWGRATRVELLTLIAYFAGIVAFTDILNIRLGVEYMTLAVVVAAIGITRRPGQFLRDWWPLLLGLLLWNLSSALAALSPFPAHLDFMRNFDRVLGFGHDPVIEIQRFLATGNNINPLDYVTGVTYNLHVPEPYIAAYLLWRVNRSAFFVFAASLLTLLVLGFITFVLFPAVPPWMASEWMHRIPDVTNRFSPVLHSHPLPFHTTPLFYFFPLAGDSVAALPSQHAGIPFLEMLVFGLALGRRAYVGFAVWVAWVLFTVVYLGEHWIVDALAGYVYAAVSLLIGLWLLRRRLGVHPSNLRVSESVP